MLVPLEWLRAYCDPGLPVDAIEERLTMTGTKVESVRRHGVGKADLFIVGRVLEAEQHPDADRLRVCRVAVGEGDVAQIVCGAPNVAAGQTVAVAQPGAVMPDGTRLGKAKLRGVTSEGMILAEDELAIGADHSGILVLDEDGLVPGTPLAEVLPGIATEVLELEITPNRPDCLGVYGVARELHAATGAPLAPPPWADDPGTAGEIAGVEVAVEAPDLNPRFTARAFEDVTIAPSPAWLKARLTAAGQRPINNVVDITNYVMLLTGQPLHAFDLDRVAGHRLTVRRARDGERVETLDGQTRTLDDRMVVIDDADGPTSIAGVMGGARSEVQDDTRRVLMEVANWDGPNIHRTSLRLGLRSEASGRFEKGLAPEQCLDAQAVAARLMVEMCGARLLPGTIDVGGAGPAPRIVRLRAAKVAAVLGIEIPVERQAEVLRALEFGVEPADDGLDVAVPPFRRNDVTREADLIEEVARIDGLEKLPATLPKRRGAAGRLSEPQRLRRRAVDALVGRGLLEAVGWSFADPAVADRLRLAPDDPRRRFVALENPMSEDACVLRTTLLGSLLDVARFNVAHGNGDLALFEHGAVCEALRVPWRVAPAEPEPFLHPGRAARVLAGTRDDEPIGWLGELHPLVAQEWEVDAAAGFEIDLDRLVAHADATPHHTDLTSFPELRQDLAVVVGPGVAAADVVRIAREAGGALLRHIGVFDRYELDGERVSLALHLAFAAPDRTLTDEEASAARERIVDRLRDEIGAEPRA